MDNELTLWGIGTTRTMRAHWMLHELGLDYECHPIRSRTGETLTPEFLTLNPRHKIPVLQHGSKLITESAAIIQYLSETFSRPEQVYVPQDAGSRATLNEWCFFIMTELDAASLYVIRRHLGLKHIYGDAPVAVESARSYFEQIVEAMAPRIGGDHEYLLDYRLSAADILMTTCLDWALVENLKLPKNVIDYRERIVKRPGYQAAFAKNFAQ